MTEPEPRLKLLSDEMDPKELDALIRYWVAEYGLNQEEKPPVDGNVFMAAMLATVMYVGATLFALGVLVGWWLL